MTDVTGDFAITNLGPGAYTVADRAVRVCGETRQVVLGLAQMETLNLTLGVAAVAEAVTVSASANVIDLSSAKIGVNVSPEEIQNLPVNGRNFANLMTLATGATSDGNGGWSSMRFNGKSNQQNYLNFDGVDGTYVWDATPGYLNVTGSQFRLQTSMESVAEFRVNSGLAPAESGLGSGGNITVVSKSGGNRFTGSLFDYKRNDALDAASKYDDQKQELSLDQFGGSIGGPLVQNRSFFFASFEGLRQTTGLRFTEAVPSAEARRRIARRRAGRERAPGRAPNGPVRWRRCSLASREGTTPTVESAAGPGDARHRSGRRRRTRSPLRLDHRFSDSQSMYVRYQISDGEVDTPDRTVTAAPRAARSSSRRTSCFNHQCLVGQSFVNEVKVGYNAPQTSAIAFGAVPGYDPVGVSLSGTVTSSSIDARGTTGIARSGLLIRASSAASTTGSLFDPRSLSFMDTMTWTRGAHTMKGGSSIATSSRSSSSWAAPKSPTTASTTSSTTGRRRCR